MELLYIIGPIVLVLLYLVPILLFFVPKINKSVRFSLLLLPMGFTLWIAYETQKDRAATKALYLKYPQANKITFVNSIADVRDSIEVLKTLMKKLPHKNDLNTVDYVINKYPAPHNYFSLNWCIFEDINSFYTTVNLLDYKIPKDSQADWERIVSEDMYPFRCFNKNEAKRFLLLIKYLDRNSMNAANLYGNNYITLQYNDSLRIWADIGFREISIDTNDSYSSEKQDLLDAQNGLYLIEPLGDN